MAPWQDSSRSGRHHIGRWLAILHGLRVQVGAIYRDQDPDRDSSLGVFIIGPGDLLPIEPRSSLPCSI